MWARFFIPVLALFYIASQVTIEQFAIIMAAFSFTTLVLEIPTGVLADLLGKRRTLLISRFMYIIEIYLVAFHNGFWIFLIAKVISGIGVSMASGTNSAVLYDTLKRLKRENEFKKVSGTLNFISNLSMAVVFIIGAYLFTISPKLPAIVSLPLISLGFILTLFLAEPYSPSHALTMRNSWRHMKEGLVIFKSNKYLMYLAFFSLPIGAAISIILSSSSLYFVKVLVPVSLIGVLAFFSGLSSAFASKKAHAIERSLGEKRSLLLIQITIVAAIMLMSFAMPYIGVAFYFLIPLAQGFYEVILGDYANHHSRTSHRATLLSIVNMFDNIGITILFPAIGYLIKERSLQVSFFALACFIVVYLFMLFLFAKHKKAV